MSVRDVANHNGSGRSLSRLVDGKLLGEVDVPQSKQGCVKLNRTRQDKTQQHKARKHKARKDRTEHDRVQRPSCVNVFLTTIAKP